MRSKFFAVAILALFFVAGSAFAADVTGTWVAEREMPKMQGAPGGGGPGGGGPGGMGGMGGGGPMKWTFNLKAEGAKLTGSVQGPMGEPSEIQDGKIEGDKVTFTVKANFMGNEMTTKYEGTVSGDEISFKTTREGGMGGGGMGGPPGGGPGGNRGERPPLIAKRQK
jgi:hypothetical protein